MINVNRDAAAVQMVVVLGALAYVGAELLRRAGAAKGQAEGAHEALRSGLERLRGVG